VCGVHPEIFNNTIQWGEREFSNLEAMVLDMETADGEQMLVGASGTNKTEAEGKHFFSTTALHVDCWRLRCALHQPSRCQPSHFSAEQGTQDSHRLERKGECCAGLAPKWDRKNRTCGISVPGHIERALSAKDSQINQAKTDESAGGSDSAGGGMKVSKVLEELIESGQHTRHSEKPLRTKPLGTPRTSQSTLDA
jgi:hypothetical protein